MFRYTLLLGALFLASTQHAGATLVHLGFSGEIVATFPYDGTGATGSFSGSLVLNTNTPDIRPEENNAHYPGSVMEGFLVWNDVSYTFTGQNGSDIYVVNDSGLLHDTFALITDFKNDDGDMISFAFQLADSTRTVFSDDSFPEFLDLAQFDEIDVTDAFSTFAVIFPYGFGQSVQGSIEFAQVRPVPVPGAFWLLASTLIAGLGYRSSQSAGKVMT